MSTIAEKYFELEPNDQGKTHLEVRLYYSLGGYSNFTYRRNPRGYYIAISPVKKGEHFVEKGLLDGVDWLIKEVTRQSKKAERESLESVNRTMGNIIDYILTKYGLKLKDGQELII